MHLRNFGSHVTVRLPDCPSVRTTGTQSTGMAPKCNSRFCLEGNRMAIWTFRERKKNKKVVSFSTLFFMFTPSVICGLQKKSDSKQRRRISLGETHGNFIAAVRKWEMLAASKVKITERCKKIKANMNSAKKIFRKHIRQFLQKNNV